MELGYRLTIEQKQKLSMTPELIQAIQILQLTNQELTEYIQNQLLENPMLESKGSEAAKDVDIQQKIIEDRRSEESYNQWQRGSDDDDDGFTYEDFVTKGTTLEEFLGWQLHFSPLIGKEMEIGEYLIENINSSGYLDVDCENVRQAFNLEDNHLVEKVLSVIQGFDPPGVGARNLSESLIIQLERKGILTDELRMIVSNKLDDLANNRIAQVSKALKVKPHKVQEWFDEIRKLNPKPGKGFDDGADINYIVPDVIVVEEDGNQQIQLNDKGVPQLMISAYYSKLRKDGGDQELTEYLNQKWKAATWLIKSIEQRRDTIFKVATVIVNAQESFFKEGEKWLRPLTLKQVAEEAGIHESTVSRAISGKYILSNQGVFELKHFFSACIEAEGGNVATSSVKALLKEIVDGEDCKKPYSDQMLVYLLKKQGIEISRRTISKYRDELGIPSSSKRRRYE